MIECNSWVITRKSTGEVIGEFYNWKNVLKFDPSKCLIETATNYLCRINKEIKAIAHKASESDEVGRG